MPEDASKNQIKKQYRRLAKIWHEPPRSLTLEEKSYATKKMQEINEAYEVLSDEQKRRGYDKEWKKSSATETKTSSPPPSPPKPEVIPKILNFGSLSQGQRAIKTFRVYNRGGKEKNNPRFVVSGDSWFDTTIQHSKSYPVIVEVTVNTQGLEVGQKYEGWIDVLLDSASAELPIVIEEVVMQPEIVGIWSPSEAANPVYFHNLKPGGKKKAKLKVKPKFPEMSSFRVRVAEPLPPWLKVEPMSFIPPVELTVEVTAPSSLEPGELWEPEVEVELILDG